jgi:hypothetical protein
MDSSYGLNHLRALVSTFWDVGTDLYFDTSARNSASVADELPPPVAKGLDSRVLATHSYVLADISPDKR